MVVEAAGVEPAPEVDDPRVGVHTLAPVIGSVLACPGEALTVIEM